MVESASALLPGGVLLGRVAVWLGKELVSYGLGKAIDKLVGSGFETELQKLKLDLEAQLARSAGLERERIQSQLALTQSQLGSLQTLLYSELNPEKIAALQRRVKEDIPRIRREIAAQERRIRGLEGDVANIEERLKNVEDRLGLRPLGRIVSVHVGSFSVADSSLPRSVVAPASDRLVARLTRDDRLRVTTDRHSPVDARVDGVLLRYSVESRPFSGYGTRTLTLIHKIELSLHFADPSGNDRYFSRIYQRERKEFFPDGVDRSASGYGVAHELIEEALAIGAEELIQFIFLEEGEELEQAEALVVNSVPQQPEPDEDETRFDEAAATAHVEMSTGLQIRFQIDPGDAFIRTWRRGEPRAIVNGRASEYDSRKKGTNTLHLFGDGEYLIYIVHDELPGYRIRIKASELQDPATIKLQLGKTR